MLSTGKTFVLFLIVIFTVGVGQTFAQPADDWSTLFPEIPNCTREIKPLQRSIYGITQSAEYMRGGALCISISLLLKSPAYKKLVVADEEILNSPNVQRLKILNYDALRFSPLCGVDRSPGSIRVNFARDKSVMITSYEDDYLISGEKADGKNSLLKIAKTLDYKLMIKSMKS